MRPRTLWSQECDLCRGESPTVLVPCRATGCRLYQPPLRHSAEQKPLLSLPGHSSFTAPGQSLGATCCSCERASPALRAVTQTGQGYCTVSWSGAQGTKGTDRLLAAYGKMLGVTGRDWSPGSGSLLPWPPVALTAFPAVTGTHSPPPSSHLVIGLADPPPQEDVVWGKLGTHLPLVAQKGRSGAQSSVPWGCRTITASSQVP